MVGIKLYAYSVDYLFEDVEILNFIVGVSAVGRFTARTTLTYTQLVDLNDYYGLKGRKMYGVWNNQVTYTKITSFYDSGGVGVLNINDWSNQVPDVGTYLKTTSRLYKNPLTVLDTKDFSELLIEEDITLTLKLESNKKFDLEASFGSFSLIRSPELIQFMESYWKSHDDENKTIIFGVEILRDGVSDFWGCSRIEDVRFDVINQTFIFGCYDWYKFLLSTTGTNLCPVFTTEGDNLELFLYFINPFGTNKIYVGDMDKHISTSDYKSVLRLIYGATGEYFSMEEDNTLGDFITELQKYYGAYLFFDKDKSLVFANRNQTIGEITIDDIIVEDTFTKSFGLKDYNRLLVNVINSTGNWTEYGDVSINWQGWCSVYLENGELKVKFGVPDADLENNDYIDLRFNFYGEKIFEYILFAYREPTEVYDDYKELLNDTRRYKCSINTLDISLLDKVIYSGTEYSVVEIEKDYLQGISKIEITTLALNFPNPFH